MMAKPRLSRRIMITIELNAASYVILDIASLRETLFFSLLDSGHPKVGLIMFHEMLSSRSWVSTQLHLIKYKIALSFIHVKLY